MSVNSKMKAIADAIRAKTGKTGILNLDQMASDLNAIPERTSSDLAVINATVTVPAGNYKSQATKSVDTATQATPNISVDSNGLITASATQTAGYVSAGTKSGTKQLTTKAATTITPSTSNQTIAAGTYLTGAQTIAGDADLKAENIKKGVNIFGVAGSYDAVELNFDIVSYSSEGALLADTPAENTIGVITNTPISGWYFSPKQPNGVQGKVWIATCTFSNSAFNSLHENGIEVHPLSVSQHISGVWTDVEAKIRQNGQWSDIESTFWIIKNGVVGQFGFEANTSTYGCVTPLVTQKNGYVEIEGRTGYHGFGAPNQKIDLTNAKAIVADIDLVRYSNSIYSQFQGAGIGVFRENNTSTSDTFLVASKNTTSIGRQTITLNLTSATKGSYYVGITVGGYSYDNSLVKVYSLKIER